MEFLKILGCAVVFSNLSAFVVFAQDEGSPRPAKVFSVTLSDSVLSRTYPASVLPSREVELSFRVSGRLIELPIRGATQVSEGDIIARLDPRDFESQIAQLNSQLAQANAQLDALRAGARPEEIAALEANVEAAQAQVDQARDNVERTRTLVERGASTNAQLEAAEAEFRVAQANLTAQQEQLRIGQVGGRAEDIVASEAALKGLETQLKVAEDNLADATLRAPFDGVIARRDVENFSNVQTGQSIALLQALDVVHLAFDIPGPDVTTLTRQGPERISNKASFDALPGTTFEAEVVEFSLQADSTTQTYRGRVAVEVPEDAVILPGMIANVTSSAPGDAAILRIPLTAVAANADGSASVWKVSETNSVSAQPVTLGEATGAFVAVTEGLADGDTIVAAGVSRIIDGMTIRPIEQVGN